MFAIRVTRHLPRRLSSPRTEMFRRLRTGLSLGLTLAASWTNGATAGPATISYQGDLETEAGEPLQGTVTAELVLYDAAIGGTALWNETHADVAVEAGTFSVQLGSVSPLSADLFSGDDRWLEVVIDGNVLSPRRPFGAVPYALRATVADSLTGGALADEDWTISGDDVYHVDGSVGIGTDAPNPDSKLDVRGNVRLGWGGADRWTSLNHVFLSRIGTPSHLLADDGQKLYMYVDDLAARFYSEQDENAGPHGGFIFVMDDDGTADPYFRIEGKHGGLAFMTRASGTTQVKVLEITGGADLAEPFPLAGHDRPPEPGMVVTIDPEHPGSLRLASTPYDPRVAGVVSGANGLSPGMVMRSDGNALASGDAPVALAGRVWCRCDAGYGQIVPGDRLTTSGTPGHAMKATDPARARGSVIGKAMTGLTEGQDLVLVLVQPQ